MTDVRLVEQIPWRGRVRVIARRRDGREEIEEISNLITDAAVNAVRDALMGVTADLEIRYVALGSDATAPTPQDSQLGAEFFRKQVTKQKAGANAGEAVTTTYIAPYEANQQIQEIGFFAGASATSATNSGVLVARVLYSRLKTELESLQIVRTDDIG